MAGRAAQLRREIESLEQQQRLYEHKKTDLEVRSPIDGVIVTWQVRDRLLFRPVERGQVLMSIADKTGEWELEIHMADDRLGHINKALLRAGQEGRKLEVDYILATDPGTRHYGIVEEIHEQAEVRGEQGQYSACSNYHRSYKARKRRARCRSHSDSKGELWETCFGVCLVHGCDGILSDTNLFQALDFSGFWSGFSGQDLVDRATDSIRWAS